MCVYMRVLENVIIELGNHYASQPGAAPPPKTVNRMSMMSAVESDSFTNDIVKYQTFFSKGVA